jgi:hypothetical protein
MNAGGKISFFEKGKSKFKIANIVSTLLASTVRLRHLRTKSA